MSHELWSSFLYSIKRDRAEYCYILEPSLSKEELAPIEKELSPELLKAVIAVLTHWHEQGGEFLLSNLPHLINPSSPYEELNPTGATMRALFPEFCQMLDDTEHFAVIIDPTIDHEEYGPDALFAGIVRHLIPNEQGKETIFWAYYMPQALDILLRHEARSGMKLSPQFKQIFLRANGAPNLIRPYFFPIESLEKGSLADIYRDFWNEIDSPESFERLEAFVSFYEDGSGNCQGFFPDDELQGSEYVIYDWDHETAQFTVWAPDFARWLKRLLLQGW